MTTIALRANIAARPMDDDSRWTDHVPNQWRIMRLKDIAQMNLRSLPEATDPEYEMEYLDIGGVNATGTISETLRVAFDGAPSRARRMVQDGDTIISTVRTYLKAIAFMDAPSPDLVVSTGFAILSPKEGVTPKYLYRLVQAEPFLATVIANSDGVSYPAITPTRLAMLPVCLPPVPEQRAIAAYLDAETAEIDAVIRRKERLVALLAEKRTALIARCVTSGLDPAAPTKPSGVAWLGDIPAQWKVMRTKHVARLESGHTPSRQHPEYWVDCTIPWVSLADVWQLRDERREYIDDTREYISELGIANSSARLLPTGTVVVSRTASVGFSGIISGPMATTQDFVNWVCGPRIQPEYLLYVFRAMQPEFRRLIMGSTHQTIYMPDVGEFVTPVPPVEEQAAIVATIRNETQRIDAVVDNTRRHIGLLEERRAALIAAAVTGQIAVGSG